MAKHVVLSEESRILLNKVKAHILTKFPEINKFSDDWIIREVLGDYYRRGKKSKVKPSQKRPPQ